MATKSISQLDTQATANETDLFEVAIVDANSASGYASKKESAAAIADAIVGEYQYPLRITGTTAKTIAGAINELKNLVDLLPQFAIEVVNTLPVSDISETTIYLVPASDPEQGNYYEEYIYVNNAWELIGTTKVNLSEYYTSAQVDTLLAAKANTADVSAALELKENAADMEEDVTDIVVDLTDTIETAEGNPIILQTVQEGYAKDVTVTMLPIQSGSGNPSPENIRPISGRNGLILNDSGINQLDNSLFVNDKWLENTGAISDLNGRKTTTSFLPIGIIKTFWFGAFLNGVISEGDYVIKIATYSSDSESSFIRAVSSGINAHTFSFSDNEKYFRIGVTRNDFDVAMNYPTTATNYEPYDGATATAEFSETIYGATGDAAGGDWKKTWSKIDLGSLEYTKYDVAQGTLFRAAVSNIKKVSSSSIVPNIICEKYRTTSQAGRGNLTISMPANDGKVDIIDNNYNDPAAFKTAMSGVGLAYELATPEPFQTAPAPLTLRKGNNTITTDGDSVKVKYNKLALPDIGGIGRYISALEARIEALEGGSSNRSLSLSPTLTKSLTSDSDTAEGKTEEETEEETKEEAQKNER